eukprot:gnl/TRDRNA2_/TRDRNA2_195434_c0_seq1.p1 gnl/TRDRNA2_/TRDRNA2_195434_c0~~gnl/TRDRNA2_/TRDRNA2_195434_c0_seq1.p1  ORF type:complete len:256 (+),score=41.41 gnl/TRDRNA2_/TRDRNA2_195434_c0_seq1:112-879(+)
MASSDKDTLIYLATNNCARIAIFIKLNKLESEIEFKSPKDYGGLKSPEFLAINPQGKFPCFISRDGNFQLFEAQVILDYLVQKYAQAALPPKSPSPEHHAKVRLLIQVHDIYIASANCTQPGYFATQGCLYKGEMGLADRSAKSLELKKQLGVIASLADSGGPYLCGTNMSLADIVLYPTFIFIMECASVSLGWPETGVVPELLAKWFAFLDKQGTFAEIGESVRGFCKSAFHDSGRLQEIRATVDSEEGKALPW